MKKTLTINLGGIVFHIDEDAYDMLKAYLEKLKVRFQVQEGNEIIADIESRIAEMFNEHKSYDKYVISIEEVKRVIETIGNPEDIAGEESSASASSQEQQYQTYRNLNRRFFRNPDDKILGGVCSGISAYFNIDPVWLRLLFALTVIFAGTGIMLYIILWIIIPEAKTPLEKMQMRGEDINLSNIEKNIRNEMYGVKDRFENISRDLASDKNKTRVKQGIQGVISLLGQIILGIFKFIGLIIGVLISLIAITVLISLSIFLFTALGWLPISGNMVIGNQFLSTILTPVQLNVSGLGVLIVVALPVVVLLLNGLKMLFKVNLNLKKIGAFLAAIWVIGIIIVFYEALDIAREFNSKAVYSTTEKLSFHKPTHLTLKSNPLYGGEVDWDNENGYIIRINNKPLLMFTDQNDSILCSDIRIDVSRSSNDSVYIVQTFSSRGRSIQEARALAQSCQYSYQVKDSTIIFDDLFNLNVPNTYRGQHIRITLKIPEGTIIFPDKSLEHMVYYMEDTPNNLESDMLGHHWKMTAEGLECLDCNKNNKRKEPVIDSDL